MILDCKGNPVEVDPIPDAPPHDSYERSAAFFVLVQYAGGWRPHEDDEDDEEQET